MNQPSTSQERRAVGSTKNGSAGSESASRGSRMRQEGAVVPAFKNANEAQNFLNGKFEETANGGVAIQTRKDKFVGRTGKNQGKDVPNSTPVSNHGTAGGVNDTSRKQTKSPLFLGSPKIQGANPVRGNANFIPTTVLTATQPQQLSSYQQNQRNTPTIVSLGGQTSASNYGAMIESQSLAEVVVAADGTTTVGHYKLGRDLGKGTFGKVKVGTHSLTGEKVAIKVLEKDKIIDVNDVDRVAREIKILKIVRHPVVVQLYEIVETQKELYLIMEYARGGELFEYIVNRKRVREKEAAKFLLQLISGIEYLHKLGICHRDLKPENLLMDDYNNIKIVDFGLSNTYRPGQTLKTACGSPCYAAPEMVAGKHYHGLPADIWSCGVILYAMVCGYLPFEDPKTNVLYKKILNADYNIPEFVSDECRDLMTKILNTDPTKRFKANEIRSHIWFKQTKGVKDYSGIIIGQNPIPVDFEQLQIVLDKYEFDEGTRENARRYIESNKHNPLTTCYYLTLKRYIRSGGKSIADITKYNPSQIERLIQNELIKQQQVEQATDEQKLQQQQKVMLPVELQANKSKTEEKTPGTVGVQGIQGGGGFVMQVPGNALGQGPAKNAMADSFQFQKTEAGVSPIEITSKLNGDRSDDVVSYDNVKKTGGVLTVASIKPVAQKQVSETQVIGMQNIQRASVTSEHRPVLTKQKQKIISSQDKPKVFNQNKPNSRTSNQPEQRNELLHRQIEQPPRNQTSCNNRTAIHKSQDKQANNQNFASVIINQGERKSKAISQLGKNSNLHYGSGFVANSTQVNSCQKPDSNFPRKPAYLLEGDSSGSHINEIQERQQQTRYRVNHNVLPSEDELQAQQSQMQQFSGAQHNLQNSYLKNKQAQKNLIMASQNTAQGVTANVVAIDTFELAQRQIQNQRKLMQMTHQQFNQMSLNGNQIGEQPVGRLQNFAQRGSSQPQGSSPMKLIPSKLTRKQILANALANQQQLPLVNAQGIQATTMPRRKPKTGTQYQSFNAQNTSASSMPQSQLVFQGHVPFIGQNMQISPIHMENPQQQQQQNSEMQYMYFTPRDLINFQSSNSKITKPQQLSFSQAAQMAPMGSPLLFNNTTGGTNQANATQANYFKNMVRLSQQPIIAHQSSTSHEARRPTQTSKIGNFQGPGANQQAFMSRQQNNNSPTGPRVPQTHSLMNRSLPQSVKGSTQVNNSGGSQTSMIRRRPNMPPQPVLQNQTHSNVIDWPNTSQQQPAPSKRSNTRGGSVTTNPINQTQLNLTNYKKTNIANTKLGNIQNILNQVPQNGVTAGAPGKNQSASVDMKKHMSRSMNVQEILNQSMENKRLNNSIINQSQDVSQRMALISSPEQPARSHLEKYHTQHLNNNYIQNMNQSFVLAGPPNSTSKPQTQTSKQAALKKKHFQFQQAQFESLMNQTQPIQSHTTQYSLPLSSYDLTQINLNQVNQVGSIGQGLPNQPNQVPSQNNSNIRPNFGGGGKFKVF